MRLYLSSFELGDRPELLSALVRGARRGWVIANALDGLDEDRRQRDTTRQIAALAALGLIARDLDLRELDAATIAAAFGAPDFVWVRGGNVFVNTSMVVAANVRASNGIIHAVNRVLIP